MADDSHDESPTDDVYTPGEASIDPAVGPGAGGQRRIATSEPPQVPTIGRWLENVPVMVERALGPVGWTLLVFHVAFDIGLVALALVVHWLVPTAFWTGEMSASSSAALAGGVVPVTLFLWGAWGFTLLGPIRPLRRVAFEGKEAVATVASAARTAGERFWPIVGTVGVLMLTFGCASGCIGQGATLADPATGGPIVSSVVTAAVGGALLFLVGPLLYLVPTTDRGLRETVPEAFRLVVDHLGYLSGGYLVIVPGMLVVTAAIAFLPRWAAGTALQIPVGIAAVVLLLGTLWFAIIAFATLFATIEETVRIE